MKRAFAISMLIVLLVASTACSGATTQTIADPVAQVINVQTSSAGTDGSALVSTAVASVAEALVENSDPRDDPDDAEWDSSTAIPIVLNGDLITAGGAGVTVDGARATITAAGTYSLIGKLTDGQVIVNTEDDKPVRLVLNGVDIHSSTGAPIYIAGADEIVIILAENTENLVSDAGEYLDASQEDAPNAAIFSMADLTITGSGSLILSGNFQDGISSKDGLVISGGAIKVMAPDDGIRGKDYLVVRNGTIMVNAGGDGLKSDNADEASKGYIAIEDGTFNITAGGDTITAQTDVMITDGEFVLNSGGGSENRIDETASAKGIKATVDVIIDGGTFTIDSADDAIHSNTDLKINGGVFNLASADDGMHADSTLEVNGGEIRITRSYEGLESAVITINAGKISIIASDDGLNVAGGVDGSGMVPGMGAMPGQGEDFAPGGAPSMGGRPAPGGGFAPGGAPLMGGGMGQDTFAYFGDYYLYINGGYVVVDAAGDGIDANGAIEMMDGVVLVNGPTERMNAALDYDSGFNLTGGLLVAAGSSGMAQAPGAASSQSSVLINLNTAQPAGTLVHIQNGAGETILAFAPAKEFQSIAFSSPELVSGETYTVSLGGSSTGTLVDGLYQGGTNTPGAEYASFTISGTVTMIGGGGGRP